MAFTIGPKFDDKSTEKWCQNKYSRLISNGFGWFTKKNTMQVIEYVYNYLNYSHEISRSIMNIFFR